MYGGIDAVGVDLQPIRNHKQIKSLYFIAFILTVSFFVLNMFVGVVVENFHHCRAQQESEQKQKLKGKIVKPVQIDPTMSRKTRFHRNTPEWRKKLYDLCMHQYFDLGIAAVVFLNVIMMSFEYYGMSKVRRYI